MKPEDVPTELAEKGREALYTHTAAHLPPVLMLPTYEGRARAVLAVVLPEHEKQLRAERDQLQTAVQAAMELYATHHKTSHPTRLIDKDCAGCQIGLTLGRLRPAKPDSREELQALVDASDQSISQIREATPAASEGNGGEL